MFAGGLHVSTASLPSTTPFTWDGYAAILDTALRNGYRFESFEVTPDRWPTERFILLRHDVDYDPRCVRPISRLEAERGVRATYLVQCDSRFYAIDEPSTRAAIRQILDDGHWLGLHFDASEISDDADVVAGIERSARRLEDEYGVPIVPVSFHMPTRRPIGHLALESGRVNTYDAIFFDSIEYVSDSNQSWRDKSVHAILSSHRSHGVQLLTHPIWWRRRPMSLISIVQELGDRLGLSVDDILTAEQRELIARRDVIEDLPHAHGVRTNLDTTGVPTTLTRAGHAPDRAPRTRGETSSSMPASEEIALAPLTHADSDILFRWINDREVVLHSAPYRPVGRAAHDAWFSSVQQREDVVIFGIRLVESDHLIGTCQLCNVHPVHRSAELRIRIGEPDARGRGYGTAAVRRLLAFGFRELGLHRVSLDVRDDNERAKALYLKAGFEDEGLRRDAAFIDGEYRSLREMAILKDEYDRRYPPA